MTANTMLNIAKIAATYAGTIMGAGFASGQELTQFFVVYGNMGLAGLLVTGFLFCWLGMQILEISYKTQATSYHEVLYYVCGKRIGLLLDIMTTLFLFGVLTIMLAGAGTICYNTFKLPYSLGLAIMAFSLIITTLYGLKGITTANIIVTPLLIITIIIIGLSSLSHHQLSLAIIDLPPQTTDLPAPHWLIASLLYLSYNLVMSTTVLAPLGSCIVQRPARILGSLTGGLILILVAGLLTIVVMIHYPESLDHEIPMLYITNVQHPLYHGAYIFIFTAAIYTTGLACLYGCAAKLTATTRLSTKFSLLVLVILSLIFSRVGFADLIGIIFPIFGYIALWFTCRLLYLSFFPK
ncbi:MAG: hypothetical protein H6Q68_1574 [Firmicutes bacterium]|nr:hypothetical protein [Bacillota bacterium]